MVMLKTVLIKKAAHQRRMIIANQAVALLSAFAKRDFLRLTVFL